MRGLHLMEKVEALDGSRQTPIHHTYRWLRDPKKE
jgi:hypothetical protein